MGGLAPKGAHEALQIWPMEEEVTVEKKTISVKEKAGALLVIQPLPAAETQVEVPAPVEVEEALTLALPAAVPLASLEGPEKAQPQSLEKPQG